MGSVFTVKSYGIFALAHTCAIIHLLHVYVQCQIGGFAAGKQVWAFCGLEWIGTILLA
jgi:hypothetical protein